MKVISRGSKSTGKNKFYSEYFYRRKWSLTKWQNDEDVTDLSGNAEKENNTCEAVPDEVYFLMMPENEVIQAKKNELQSLKDNQVYTEVTDAGQDRAKIRWIYTTKEFSEGRVVKP